MTKGEKLDKDMNDGENLDIEDMDKEGSKLVEKDQSLGQVKHTSRGSKLMKK
jgi:hypothetical protein